MSTAAFPKIEVERPETIEQTLADLTYTAMRVKGERDQAMHLLRATLGVREMGSQGPLKSDIRMFLAFVGERADTGRSALRIDRLHSIEHAIAKVNPDPRESIEILHALQATLRYQFDERSNDAQDALSAACAALEELERTVSTIDAADDAQDLEARA